MNDESTYEPPSLSRWVSLHDESPTGMNPGSYHMGVAPR